MDIDNVDFVDIDNVDMNVLLHVNGLSSCVSGLFCSCAEEVMSSVASLEQEHMVCVLDICLLGDGKAEVICSRVFRTRDLITSQTSSAQ